MIWLWINLVLWELVDESFILVCMVANTFYQFTLTNTKVHPPDIISNMPDCITPWWSYDARIDSMCTWPHLYCTNNGHSQKPDVRDFRPSTPYFLSPKTLNSLTGCPMGILNGTFLMSESRWRVVSWFNTFPNVTFEWKMLVESAIESFSLPFPMTARVVYMHYLTSRIVQTMVDY